MAMKIPLFKILLLATLAVAAGTPVFSEEAEEDLDALLSAQKKKKPPARVYSEITEFIDPLMELPKGISELELELDKKIKAKEAKIEYAALLIERDVPLPEVYLSGEASKDEEGKEKDGKKKKNWLTFGDTNNVPEKEQQEIGEQTEEEEIQRRQIEHQRRSAETNMSGSSWARNQSVNIQTDSRSKAASSESLMQRYKPAEMPGVKQGFSSSQLQLPKDYSPAGQYNQSFSGTRTGNTGTQPLFSPRSSSASSIGSWKPSVRQPLSEVTPLSQQRTSSSPSAFDTQNTPAPPSAMQQLRNSKNDRAKNPFDH